MSDLMASRWRGQPGRLEVWYTTLTDPATGTGFWLHHELMAPTDGSPAYAHGLAAVFRSRSEPVHRRFGPVEWAPDPAKTFKAGPVEVTKTHLAGVAEDLAWDLRMHGGGAPLFTFPTWAWRREILPAAQIVPAPVAHYTGIITVGKKEIAIDQAPGATAHIYRRGNAKRWAWLHADLGNGDVLEVVAAVASAPFMRGLRPLPLLKLRLDGEEHPNGDTLLAARRLRADISLPTWRIHGRIGDHELDVVVTQPPGQTVTVPLLNPDGSRTLCHNSETATADITWAKRGRTERTWHIADSAHAEVGG
ncbi:hypothetical protein [Kribbella ginsengisoli]|uniref:Uncharacterized protein n=1 Tax=Kribbella ginsengisoli TaxID=363865 RepID=A0ABP6ZD57_9ACTN